MICPLIVVQRRVLGVLRSGVVFGLISTAVAIGAASGAAADEVLTVGPGGTVKFTVAPPELTNKKTADFEFTASGDTTCQIDDGETRECSGTVAVSDLTDGTHTFTVTNSDGTSATHEWAVDTLKPVVSFRHTIKGYTGSNIPTTNETSASFTFSTSDPTAEFTCRIDPPINYLELTLSDGRRSLIPGGTGPFVPCASPQALSGLAEGHHEVGVRATDRAGNVTRAGIIWKVDYDYMPPDTTPPMITFDEPRKVDPHTYEVSFRVSEDATLRCWHSTGPFTSGTSRSLQNCTSPISLTDVPEGRNQITVEATDPSGNRASQGRGWTVDRTPPEVLIGSAPGLTTGSSAVLRFSSSESASRQTFHCSLDKGSWAPCASPVEIKELTHGPHAFAIRVTDGYGNTSEPNVVEWSADTIAPEARIISGPQPESSSTEAVILTEVTGDAALVECSFDDLAWMPCEIRKVLSGLAEGPHAFRVRATDRVGNTGPVATHEWSVDTTVPEVQLVSKPGDPSPSAIARLAWTSEPGASFKCRLDDGEWAECVSPKTYSALPDGSHTFEIRGSDRVGNAGSAVAHSWTVAVPSPPVTDPLPTVSIDSGPSDRTTSRSASFAITHTPGSILSCRNTLFGIPFNFAWKPCKSPVVINGFQDGNHSFEVRAVDPAGRVSVPGAWVWRVDTIAPPVTITSAPLPTTVTTLASFSFRSSDREATFECRLDSGVWSACSGSSEIQGLTTGPHTFEVVATDFLGNRSAPARYSWEVVLPIPEYAIFGEPEEVEALQPQPESAPVSEPAPVSEQRPDPEPLTGDEPGLPGGPSPTVAQPRTLDPPRIRSAPSRTASRWPLFRISAPAPDTENFCSIDKRLAVRCGSAWRPTRKLSIGLHSFTVQGRAGDGQLTSAVTHQFRVMVSR